MLIGASIAAEDLEFYEPLFAGNDIMRIFPVRVTVDGDPLRVLPDWSDSRLEYCRRHSAVPFLSTKVDGRPGGLEHVRRQLADMPAWIERLYLTDRHEPEGDLPGGPAEFKVNFGRFLDMIDTLPRRIRTRVRCGPVLTKTWTENKDKGDFQYRTYDPGTGDFFGVDCYVPAGTSHEVMAPSRLPKPADFLRWVKAYEHSPSDARPRILPELGLIGMPDDRDGSARAAWIKGVHTEMSGWHTGVPGWSRQWSLLGWIWWNQQGKNTGDVDRIGSRRDFPLDERTVDRHTAAKLDPPKPLTMFNTLWKAQRSRPRHAAMSVAR
ncbi:hypothetical protein SAMN04489716_0811 [Actinoplanes derwentensis]|uniref:Uncharacterized protein n=1 Tax=Actinoplanes derwentensis TaxID=113562 RepID=A0A1H1SB39_9ACTN|nr:hypothetical protein SAMN04489716_0811 [Actinoplanes derwentensis]